MIPILYDSNESAFVSNGLCRLRDCISCVVSEERNSIYECTFQYPVTGANYDLIKCGRIIAVIHDDTDDIQPFDIVSFSRPIDGVVTFRAVHISYRQSKMTASGTNVNSLSDAFHMLKNAKPSNPFTYWTDKKSTGLFAAADGVPRSVRQMLGGSEGSILDCYGGEYEWDKWTVKLWGSRGKNLDLAIRYGLNLMNYDEEVDFSETFTSCIPYWVGGDDNAVVKGNVVKTGVASFDGREKCVPLNLTDKFQEKPTAQQLETLAAQLMDSNRVFAGTQSIKVEFTRLQDSPEYESYAELMKCSLCDSINVVFPAYDTSARFKIVKTVYDVLEERFSEMELGSLSTTLSQALGLDNNNVSVSDMKVVQAAADAQGSANMANGILAGMEAAASAAHTTLNGIYATAEDASDTLAEMKDAAEAAETTLTGIYQDAADAKTAASSASTAAASAQASATQAIADAATAKSSADSAQASANQALANAATAQQAANNAQRDATNANKAANGALTQLSVVEDVVGVLNWIAEHGTYAKTSDTEVVPGKYYFTRSGSSPNYTYAVVVSPTGNPHTKGYYELTGTDEAVANYVSSHLALTNQGLWVINDNSSYKILLASDGMKVYDAQGILVATFGESISFSSTRPQYIGNNNSYIVFDPTGSGSLTIGGASIRLGNQTLDEVLAEKATTESLTSEIAARESAVNLLLDSDAPNTGKVYAEGGRYFSDTARTQIVATNFELADPPENGIKYGRRFVCDGTNTSLIGRAYAFYNSTDNVIPFIPNTTYTATWWARCTAGQGTTRIHYPKFEGSTSTASSEDVELTSEWQKVTAVFTTGSTPNSNYNRIWFYARFPANTAGTIEICGCKLVAGDAVEQYKTSIEQTANNVLIKATRDGASASDKSNGGKSAIGLINVSPDSVQIEAEHVDIKGVITAINDEGTTTIDGDKITTGSIKAAKLDIDNINNSGLINTGALTVGARADVLNSNIAVGGRNLILNTVKQRVSPSSATVSSNYPAPNPTLSDYGHSIMNNTTDEWTYSFDYEVTGNSSTTSDVYVQIRGSMASGSSLVVSGNKSGHYSKTFKLSSAQASATSKACRIRLRNATDGAVLKVSNIKLEKGNKETDWSSAPEDYITDIDGEGIYIHPAGQSPSSGSEGNSVLIDGDGMTIYKNGESVASYGTSVRIGNSSYHVDITSDSFTLQKGIIAGPIVDIGHYDGIPFFIFGSQAPMGLGPAPGDYSISEGNQSIAAGACSHASGEYVEAWSDYQTAIGKFNANDANNAFEIGWGTSDSARKNIFEVTKTGDVKANGVSISSTNRTAFTPAKGANYSYYGGCYYEKCGCLVHVHVGINGLTANTANNIYTLPTGCRPASLIVAHGTGGSWNNLGYVDINTSGVIQVRTEGTACCADAVFMV